MFLENNEYYDFDWIPTCVNMLIYRPYISGDINMWSLVSNMIVVTNVLVVSDIPPPYTITNIL